MVELKDEKGITYPKNSPQTDYLLKDGNSIVYIDGLKSSQESIKSKCYTVTDTKTGDYMNLNVTDAYPKINARLLYGLAHFPGDVGLFFMPFGEIWNISSKQWPTLISGKNYSLEMTCFGSTDYHVDPSPYKEETEL